MKDSFKIIVKTLAGLEDVLANELHEMGLQGIELGRRAVICQGNLEDLYRINMQCRTALKVLKPIDEFTAQNADEVYEAVKSLDWEEYLDLNQSFLIDSVVFSSNFSHSKFVAYKVKDAIADFFMAKYDKRPSVGLSNPDIRINIHIAEDQCTLSLDSSGESLHKRGWRSGQTEAPINEVLAAGILLMAGWKGQCDFYDPMCGSGTFLVEALMIAKNIAPGLYRDSFAFEKWKDFDQDLLDSIYNDDSSEKEFEFNIYGSDIHPQAVKIAEENIKSAGFSKYITLTNEPFANVEPLGEKGIIVMNPPYGERLQMPGLNYLYETIGERLKHHFPGFNAWIISHKEECFNNIGLRPSQRINLLNGSLECQLRQYEMFDGSKKEHVVKQLNDGEKKKIEVKKRSFKKVDNRRPEFDKPKFSKSDKDFKKSDDTSGKWGNKAERNEKPEGDKPKKFRFDKKRLEKFKELDSFGEKRPVKTTPIKKGKRTRIKRNDLDELEDK